jgi:flagellar hook-associated protein 1 FlgK
VQSYRQQIDQQVASDVSSINSDINRVNSLNNQIAALSATGSSTAALEDQRTQALNDLSKYLSIKTYTLSNGGVGISTANGVALLDSAVHQLVYSAAGTVDASTQFAPITVNQVDPGTGAVLQTSMPLDAEGQPGSLGALLSLRDGILPNLAAQLGEIGAQVAAQLNAVHNGNSAVPPPNQLTGQNTGLAASDLQDFTGQTTFYVFDSNNAVVKSATVNFTPGATLGAIISQVNSTLGGQGTLALTNGVLTFTGAPGTGVAIKDGSPPSSRGGQSFAQFFGMNNLVTTSVPGQYNTGLTTSDQSGFAGKVTLDLVGPNNTTAGQYTLDFTAPPLSTSGATMGDVINQLNTGFSKFGTFSLDQNGALTFQTNSTYSGDTLEVSQDTSNRLATGMSFSQLFGIGANFVANAAQGFQVRSDISANPGLLALAQVDTTAATGTPALTSGDASGAIALQQVAQNTVSFPAAGGLPAAQSTLSNYVGIVLGTAAQQAAQAQTANTDQKTLQSTVQNQVDSVSGVNLDEEMSNMVVYQNAYTASAQMIAAISKLFNTLMTDVSAA